MKQELKILYICNQFLPEIGGVTNYIYKSSLFFPKYIKIFIFTIKNKPHQHMNEKIGNMHIRRFHSQFHLGPFIISLGLISTLIRYKNAFDLINIQGFYRFHTFLTVILKIIGVNVIITSHGLANDTPPDSKFEKFQKYFYDHTVIPFLSLFCSKVIVVSKPEKLYLIKMGVSKDKINIVHGGANINYLNLNQSLINNLNIPTKNKLLGYVGTLEHRKNVFHILKSYSNLIKEIDISLILVGPYTSEQLCYIKNAIYKLNLGNNIFIKTGFSDADIAKVYQMLDIFIFPSRNEGFPLVLIEAALYGVPFVSYNLPSIRYINSILQCGLLAEYNNIYDLTQKIIQLLFNKELYDDLSEKGKKAAFKLNWKRTATNLLNIYKEILNI